MNRKLENMEYIKIGRIVNAVGLKGEVKIYHYSDYKERFEEINKLYIEGSPREILSVRYVKNLVVVKLSGISDRTMAEALKEKDVFIDQEDLRELPEGTYYVKDLKGISVLDERGKVLGVLTDVIKNSAQDIYEIEKENKDKFLIPAVESFILNIDLDAKKMIVHVIDGLLE